MLRFLGTSVVGEREREKETDFIKQQIERKENTIMWFSSLKCSIKKQHEAEMQLIKEQQRTLSEIEDALRKITAQQTKVNSTIKETVDRIVKEDAAKDLIKGVVNSMTKAITKDELKELIFKTMEKNIAETVKDMVKKTVKIAVSENGNVSIKKKKKKKNKDRCGVTKADIDRWNSLPPDCTFYS